MQKVTTFSDKVTRAVKAELARRGMNGSDLVAPLGLSRNAVYSRLRNESPFDTAEIEKIAAALGTDVGTIFASAALEDREAVAA